MKTFCIIRQMFWVALAFAAVAIHAQPVLVNIGHTNNGGTAQGIVVSGNYAYVAAGTNGLLIYDISNPAMPVKIAQTNVAPGTQAYHLAISSNYVYVTALDSPGFDVFNVSRPSAPSNIFSTNYNLFGGVAVNGTNLYIGGDGRLPVFNISNPASPVLVSNATVANNPINIAISSNFIAMTAIAYLNTSTQSNGIYTANPYDLYVYPNYAEDVAIAGQYLFVAADASSPLYTYQFLTNSITNVAHVSYASSNSAGEAYSIAISGNYAYLGCAAGLRMVNIANPTNLIPAAQIATNFGGIPYGIAVSGPYVYVANGNDGLRVFEVLPSVAAQTQGGSLLFSWSATSSFALQQMPINGTNWTTLTNMPTMINGTNQIYITPSGSGALFRLISM